jgi:hypothetical protein
VTIVAKEGSYCHNDCPGGTHDLQGVSEGIR